MPDIATFLHYLVSVGHVLGFSMLLGGGLAVAALRGMTRRAPAAREFFEAANQGLLLFFWAGLVLVISSGILLQVEETGALVPDLSTSRGFLIWLKGFLLLPVLAKSIVVTYYSVRHPGGRTYPAFAGAMRVAFVVYDLVLVVVIVMLGVLIHFL